MISVEHVRDLRLDGGGFLAAGSGLVHMPGHGLLVVADDRPLIARFEDHRPGRVIALSRDVMPEDPAERKALKPDLESLALLTRDTLITLGSGSTERRERGWIWGPDGPHEEISLSRLYARLRGEVADLNIEGAARTRDGFWLAQRGNGADGADAIVEVDMPARAVRSIRPVDLPEIDGVGLTLSDLAPLDDGTLLFCAVAEATDSTYDDGECVGAAIGRVDPRTGEVLRLERLPQPWKVEGITRRGADLLLVADADDPERPAPLLRVSGF